MPWPIHINAIRTHEGNIVWNVTKSNKNLWRRREKKSNLLSFFFGNVNALRKFVSFWPFLESFHSFFLFFSVTPRDGCLIGKLFFALLLTMCRMKKLEKEGRKQRRRKTNLPSHFRGLSKLGNEKWKLSGQMLLFEQKCEKCAFAFLFPPAMFAQRILPHSFSLIDASSKPKSDLLGAYSLIMMMMMHMNTITERRK